MCLAPATTTAAPPVDAAAAAAEAEIDLSSIPKVAINEPIVTSSGGSTAVGQNNTKGAQAASGKTVALEGFDPVLPADKTTTNANQDGVFTSIIVMFVLLFLTPVFALVPYNAIGAIIIAGCVTLFEWKVALQLWKTNFRDFLCWVIAMGGVLFLGVELGLGVAITLSLFLYILETAFPHTAILGRVEKTDLTVSTEQYKGMSKGVPGVLALRMDAPMYFGNVLFLEDKIDEFMTQAELEAKEGAASALQFIILDLTPCSHIDSSGCYTIGVELAQRLRKKGIQVVLAGPNGKVLRNLDRSGVLDEVGRDWVFSNTADAFDACLATPKIVVDTADSGTISSSSGEHLPFSSGGLVQPDTTAATGTTGIKDITRI
eukprot:gene498-768_t